MSPWNYVRTFRCQVLPLLAYCVLIGLPNTLVEAHSQDPNQYLNAQDDLSHWPAEDASAPHPLPADLIPLPTREHWMRRAVTALSDLNDGSPCPFAAFGCVIVNHSAIATGKGGTGNVHLGSELGEEICIGANAIVKDGNPTLHGE